MEEKNAKTFKNPFKDMDEEKKKVVIGAGLFAIVLLSGLAYYFNVKIESQKKTNVQTEKPPVNVVERDVSKERWTTEESKKIAELQENQKRLEEALRKSEEEKKALQQQQTNNLNNLPPIVLSNTQQPTQPIQPPPLPPQQPVSLPPPPPPQQQNPSVLNQQPNQNLPPLDTVVQKPKKTYTVMTDLIEYNSGSSQVTTGEQNHTKQAQSGGPISQSENTQNVAVSVENTGGVYSTSKGPSIKKTINTYIPPGTFSKVVLLSGVDAPSGSGASGNPVPVLFKVKDLSILPNRFRSDFRECFIIGSAKGDLKSERAYIRAETLSCVKRDGSVLERNVTGYVAGEDGKAGLSGRVVTKAGQMIARSILAGFVEGVARAFSQQAMTISVSPLGQTSTIDPNRTLKYGVGQGVSSGARKLVDYYLNLANDLIPVIEINAGREVDFVFLKGVDLSDGSEGGK
jgi:conjugal transfer pilus assembly protein TraB